MSQTYRYSGWVLGFYSLLLVVPMFAQEAGFEAAPPIAESYALDTGLPCQGEPGFHVLDFWLGEWDVIAETGQKQGTNRIEKMLDGCAIMEHWTDILGGAGKSLFYYNPITSTWKQIWITQDTTRPGGLKEKTLVETFEDGGVLFQGTIPVKQGQVYLDRTRLTPLEDGTVRQRIEYSTDDGQTWKRAFEAIYVPRDG